MKRYIRSAIESNEELAQNSTDPEVLVRLANDADEDVRWHVAENLNTPTDVLAQLANDEDEWVRKYVAGNPNTPPDVIKQLFKDEDVQVSQMALYNPSYPKKSKKSKKSNTWPSADKWEVVEYGEEFEDMWDRYLAGPENEVNKTFKIFPEPSIQGGYGSMVIFDESEDENEPVYVDFQDWVDRVLSMAAESKNANEYKQKYKGFIEDLISENWR